jgi:hypothetical protein
MRSAGKLSSTAFADQILKRIEFCFYPVCKSSDLADGLLKLSHLATIDGASHFGAQNRSHHFARLEERSAFRR